MATTERKQKGKARKAPQTEEPGTISNKKPRKDAYKAPGAIRIIERLKREISNESQEQVDRVGSFSWYVEKAKTGDASAVLHVLRLTVESVSEEVLRQNNGLIDPIVAKLLYDELGAVVAGKKSTFLKMEVPNKKQADEAAHERKFWFAVDVVTRMNGGEKKAAALEAERKSNPKILSSDNAESVYKQYHKVARQYLKNKSQP